MRGIFISILVLGWLPLILFKPHIGVLVWSWISHMNPHRLTYGFAYNFEFLNFIAIFTVVGVFLSKDRIKIPAHPILFTIALYFIWTIFTTIAGFDSALSVSKLTHMSKVLLFAFISILIMRSPNRLKAFVFVMILSLAFLSVKGSIYTVFTGGSGRVQGFSGMIGDNNQLAMALSMMLPVSAWLIRYPPLPYLKWPAVFLTASFALSVLGTHSRGGLAALAIVTAMALLKARQKLAIAALIIPIGMTVFAYMPDSWRARMATIETATEDESFQGRVSMWKFSANLVEDHPLEGGGFRVFEMRRPIDLYMPFGYHPRAPHSIYFEVLGEHGYVGLILFLTMLFVGWYAAGAAAGKYQGYEETRWLSDLSAALQLGLVGYAVGGLTVNIATFDLFYHFLAVIVMIEVVGDRLLAKGDLKDAEHMMLKTKSAVPKKQKWRPAGWGESV